MKNINGLISFLKETLHISVSISDDKLEYIKPLPHAIKSNYDIYNVRIQNTDVALLSVDEDGIRSIKKHLSLFERSLSIPIVLHIKRISSSTKRYLIENGVSFVSERSIYLPQLLIHLNDLKEYHRKERNKRLSKLAQIILITLIIQGQRKIDIQSSAEMFDVARMSTSRALKELVEHEYLDVESIGRKKEFFLKKVMDVEKLMLELKDPVADMIFIRSQDLDRFDKKVVSSYSALSRYTNITNSQPIYAIEKEYFNKLMQEGDPIATYDKGYDDDLAQVELWRYRTQISDDNIADPISLYVSLKDKTDVHDSRVSDAMSELYKKIQEMIS